MVNQPTISVREAIIEEIFIDRQSAFVTIAFWENQATNWNWNRNTGPTVQTVRLVVTPNTRIFDENGNSVSVRQLEEGMIVNAAFSAAMTRSIPPQAQAFRIGILRRETSNRISEGRIVEINQQNRFIVTKRGREVIRFNTDNQTVIRGPFGRRIQFRDLRVGFRVRVTHANFMTASIPPQTTAFVIEMI